MKIWFVIPIILICMLICADWFYNIWVGDKIVVPFALSLSMSLFVLLVTFNLIYVNFLNGIGKIRIQLMTSLISIVINVPLSILFVKFFHLGLEGVILATCTCLGYAVILRPIQYYKIINNKAKGIWNK